MKKFSWQDAVSSIRKIYTSGAVKSAEESLKKTAEKLCSPNESRMMASKLAAGAQHLFSCAKKSAEQSRFASDLKKNAHTALLHSLRTVGALCTAGADQLERHAEGQKASPTSSIGQASTKSPEVLRFAAGKNFYRRPFHSRQDFVPSSSSHYRSGRRFSTVAVLLSVAAVGALAGGLYYYYASQVKATDNNDSSVISKLEMLSRQESSEKPAQNAAPSEQAVTAMVRITRSGVNLRDGHSLKGTKILAKLDAGTAEVLEKWQDQNSGQIWYHIQSVKGTGWVSGRYAEEVKPEKEIEPGVTQGFLKGTRINVRDGHSTRGTNVLTQMSNQTVTLLERWHGENDAYPWYRIQIGEGDGWVYGRYVEVR
jgi:hypothetical protein